MMRRRKGRTSIMVHEVRKKEMMKKDDAAVVRDRDDDAASLWGGCPAEKAQTTISFYVLY